MITTMNEYYMITTMNEYYMITTILILNVMTITVSQFLTLCQHKKII
jgi:hypothetical protein